MGKMREYRGVTCTGDASIPREAMMKQHDILSMQMLNAGSPGCVLV